MYAVIQTGGKQYKVTNDEVIGTPFVEGAKVTAEVLKNGKGKKIRVATYKPKKGEKRAKGHRQPYTQVKITSIEA